MGANRRLGDRVEHEEALVRTHPAGLLDHDDLCELAESLLPDPIEFRATTIKRFNEGGLFWVYLGHGHVQLVDFLHVPGDRHPVFDVFAMSRLSRRQSAPIALFFACYNRCVRCPAGLLGRGDAQGRGGRGGGGCGFACDHALRHERARLELMDEHFQQRRATIGEVLLHAKRDSVLASRDDARSKAVDGMARILNPLGPDLTKSAANM